MIQECLKYNPETGDFIWIKPIGRGTKIGEIAGYKNPKGYIEIRYDGILYRAHQLAFLFLYGYIPEHPLVIDHINRNTYDNRECNLRCVNRTINNLNSKISIKNTSGFKGVSYMEANQKYRASFMGKHLGLFKTAEEASEAYIKAFNNFNIGINGLWTHNIKIKLDKV